MRVLCSRKADKSISLSSGAEVMALSSTARSCSAWGSSAFREIIGVS